MIEESNRPQQNPQATSAEAMDWFLASLVNMVNGMGSEIGITLQVSGFLVSGFLVGGAKYFDGFASDFASTFPEDQDRELIRKAFAGPGDIYKTIGETDADPASPTFVHLKGARFFNTSGKPIPANRGVWWRGRLSEVSGFILGSLSEGA